MTRNRITKKLIGILLIMSMSIAILSMNAFAASKTKTGTYNTRTYTASLTVDSYYMYSRLQYPTSIQLGFTGYGTAVCGTVTQTVSCANNGMGKSCAKTVNPPSDAYTFSKGTQTYYCNSHTMTTINA